MKKILLTGGTGLIGRKLTYELIRQNFKLNLLTRSLRLGLQNEDAGGYSLSYFQWDAKTFEMSEETLDQALDGVVGVVHLAGEPIAEGIWSPQKKRKIIDSRILSSQKLFEAFQKRKQKNGSQLEFFIGASAIGFYGDQKNQILSENSPLGTTYLAEVCDQWEKVAQSFESIANRVVHIRIGIVLDRNGGALKSLLPLAKSGLAGPVGSGEQWMSWIHIEDLVQIFIACVQDKSLTGIFNATSPNPVRNHVFMKALAKSCSQSIFVSVPEKALQLMLGEKASVILSSQRVIPQRLIDFGFKFKYPSLDHALKNICSHLHSKEFFRFQIVQKRLDEVFSFFSKPQNLQKITPPWLDFEIVQKGPFEMKKGCKIDYRLKLHGIPTRWTSQIASWDPPHSFSDIQVRGPYKEWIHTHSFYSLGNEATLLADHLYYQLPFGLLGKLVGGAYVDRQVRQIFDYRRSEILKLF